MAAKATQPVERDGFDGILRRSVDITVRSIDEEARTVEVVASTDTIDSHGDIVDQTFKLSRYKKNPTVLWHHNRFGYFGGQRPKDYLPIGHASNVKIEDGKLSAKLHLGDEDYSELADKIFRGFVRRHIRAVSIGFRPGTVQEEDVKGKRRYRLKDNELYEISVVPIGSNPDAVAKATESGEVVTVRDQELAYLRMRSLEGEHSPPETKIPSRETAETRKGTNMDPEKLQAELDKAKSALAVAEADLARVKSETTIATEKLDARVKELEAKLAELTKSRDTLAEEAKQAKADLDAANKKNLELEAKGIAAEVEALVGKKITPAQRESFIKMRATSPDIFTDVVKGLPDLGLEKDETGDDPDTENKAKDPTGSSASAELAAQALKAAQEALRPRLS